jgi:hypothetical protein
VNAARTQERVAAGCHAWLRREAWHCQNTSLTESMKPAGQAAIDIAKVNDDWDALN